MNIGEDKCGEDKCGAECAKVVEDVSLDCQFEQMDGALNQLFNSLETLATVTEQYVRPDLRVKEVEQDHKVPEEISPVANTVREFTEKIRRANDGLTGIINRVDHR